MPTSFNTLLLAFRKLFSQKKCKTVEEIRWRFVPFAVGFNNDGVIIPTGEILRGNGAVDQWIDMMQFYNMTHLKYWLEKCNAFDSETLMMDFMAEIGQYGCQEHVFPFIEYVARPEQTLVGTGTMLELIHLYNMTTVGDLGAYIYSIIILGIFLNDYLAGDVLMIQNPQEFIAARLFQGEIDFIMSGGQTESTFLPKFGSAQNVYSSEPMLQSMEGEISPEEFNTLVTEQRALIDSSTYLGNETPQVIAMKEALKLSETYSDYLEIRGPIAYQKVGPLVYESIALGESKRHEVIFKGWDRRELRPPKWKEHGNVDFANRKNPNFPSTEKLPKTVVGKRTPVFGTETGGAVNETYQESRNQW